MTGNVRAAGVAPAGSLFLVLEDEGTDQFYTVNTSDALVTKVTGSDVL
ncbi:MAG: hypothetical protein RQ826_02645 [Xanthomonadales bacterium]|nr:hypothetical protein [Xanthomonadales bacterium]